MLCVLTKPLFEPIKEILLKCLRTKVLLLTAITSARRLELRELLIKLELYLFHNNGLKNQHLDQIIYSSFNGLNPDFQGKGYGIRWMKGEHSKPTYAELTY